jgi:type II restriction/modification system DNA methylase subunit YeeA
MPTTLSPQEFVRKWRPVDLTERAAAHSHFDDLCRLIGHPTPLELDPTGSFFAYEFGAKKTSGRQGWADVWKREYFGWEYKAPGKDLGKAYDQLLQYREALENPPLLIVSDIKKIIIHSNITNTPKRVEEITLDDLVEPAALALLRSAFYSPLSFRAPRTTAQVTQEAAETFARLSHLLRGRGVEPKLAAHFLIQILFCLFAEDAGLLRENVFTKLLQQTRTQPPAFARQLQLLFGEMATGGWFGTVQIPYFNGGLFRDAAIIPLDHDELDLLMSISGLDWSAIEPSIFGTLFERSLDPGKRSQLGAHYTSKDDILLIIEPVLIAPLRRRWTHVQGEARALAARRDAAQGGQWTKLQSEMQRLLTGFAGEIASTRVLDPACGSGNFLYVALKQLLDLEKEVITFAGDLGLNTFWPTVGPEQLHGIEIDPYAHELAQVTVWIGYLQWLRDNGYGVPGEPLLKSLETIQRMDALLAFDDAGQPIEPTWPAADVVIGNPPFLGGKRLRSELGDKYVDTIFRLYDGQVPREADLVTYWFERSRALIAAGQLQRAGLLATQTIRMGSSRKLLEHIKQSGDIFLAWSDRPWVVEGAAVRVSMVGFDNGGETLRTLDGDVVTAINANLTSATDLTTAQRLSENAKLAFMSDTKGGAFDISVDVAGHMLAAPLNPNGRPNSDVVRPWVNGLDITRRPRSMWIIDFGIDLPEDEAALYEQPYEYVRQHVLPERMKNNRAAYRDRWWIHVEPRPAMWRALKPLDRFIVTPSVAKHRLFAWLKHPTVPDHKLFAIAREDDYFFGVLHSHAHEVWSLATSSRQGVGNDPVYNNTTCFETFPFPWPPSAEPADDPRVTAIAAAAADLVVKRDAWLNPPGADEAELKKRTLTNLYNARPAWLDMAHAKLDQAVLAAYGWPYDLSDEEVLARLLALNLARAAGQDGAVVAEE